MMYLVTGGSHTDDHQTDVFDPSAGTICRNELAEIPNERQNFLSGAVLNGLPTVCGGYVTQPGTNDLLYVDKCYQLNSAGTAWNVFATLASGRAYMGLNAPVIGMSMRHELRYRNI